MLVILIPVFSLYCTVGGIESIPIIMEHANEEFLTVIEI